MALGATRWTLASLCGLALIGTPAFSQTTTKAAPQTTTAPQTKTTAPTKPASQTKTASPAAAPADQQKTFGTPEEAVKTLIDTVKKGDLDTLIAIFGQQGKELLDTSEPATARMNRQVFTVAAAEQWHLTNDAVNRRTLVIGNEDWPFPVPLVHDAKGWRFDTAAGKEEVIARRIGHNELATIATVRAYVTAQQRYASQGHDGNQPGIYAVKLQSDPGKENGLYWPTTRGQSRSPLGDLVAQAAEEGRPVGGNSDKPAPFQGYYFKILTAQGAAAKGGAKSYVAKGLMSGGFALVAWPAQYNVTGVMTFIVNQDGAVREKNLGPNTDATVQKMTAYNPDTTWRIIK
jgi:hypothetical protein